MNDFRTNEFAWGAQVLLVLMRFSPLNRKIIPLFSVSLTNKTHGEFHCNVNMKVNYEDKKKKFNHDEEGEKKETLR